MRNGGRATEEDRGLPDAPSGSPALATVISGRGSGAGIASGHYHDVGRDDNDHDDHGDDDSLRQPHHVGGVGRSIEGYAATLSGNSPCHRGITVGRRECQEVVHTDPTTIPGSGAAAGQRGGGVPFVGQRGGHGRPLEDMHNAEQTKEEEDRQRWLVR